MPPSLNESSRTVDKNRFVVDTNVLAVANGFADHLPDSARIECERFLLDLYRSGIVHIDSLNLIFDEYFRYASRAGQPGVADAFAKYLWDQQSNPSCCLKIEITPIDGDVLRFRETDGLPFVDTMDPADRKFVAVAFNSPTPKPAICDASDNYDWDNIAADLKSVGIPLIAVLAQ